MGPSPTDLELMRLARLLKVDVARLEGLREVGVADLRLLRDQIGERLFSQGRDAFHKAAAVAGMVPAGLSAKLAERALGPVLSARTTAVLDPDKAVELAGRFPASYLADVAVEMDPRAVDDLVQAMPPSIIAAVGEELARRGEWLVMADFVGAITTGALVATLHGLTDESIIRAGQLLEDTARLDEVIDLLDDERLAAITASAEGLGLQDQLEALRERMGEEQRARLA